MYRALLYRNVYICNTLAHSIILSRSIGDRCVYKPSSIRSADVVKTFKAIHFTTPLQKAHISHLDMACSKLYMHCQITSKYICRWMIYICLSVWTPYGGYSISKHLSFRYFSAIVAQRQITLLLLLFIYLFIYLFLRMHGCSSVSFMGLIGKINQARPHAAIIQWYDLTEEYQLRKRNVSAGAKQATSWHLGNVFYLQHMICLPSFPSLFDTSASSNIKSK
jgi:hypothetical protein